MSSMEKRGRALMIPSELIGRRSQFSKAYTNVTVQDISRAIADVTGAYGYTEDEKTQIEKTLCDLFRQFVNLRV